MINIFSLCYTNWVVSFTAGCLAGHCDLCSLKLGKHSTTKVCLRNSSSDASGHTGTYWSLENQHCCCLHHGLYQFRGHRCHHARCHDLDVRVGQQFVPLCSGKLL